MAPFLTGNLLRSIYKLSAILLVVRFREILTSGINGALHLPARLAGMSKAKKVADLMQYKPRVYEKWPRP
jgi:hypothetical protein